MGGLGTRRAHDVAMIVEPRSKFAARPKDNQLGDALATAGLLARGRTMAHLDVCICDLRAVFRRCLQAPEAEQASRFADGIQDSALREGAGALPLGAHSA